MDPKVTQPAVDKEVIVGKYKLKVIRNTCIGAASCVAVSAPTYELDSESKAVVKADSQDIPDNILLAAQSCPTKAIVVIDNQTGEQIWPS